MGDCHVRFCESAEARFPRATRLLTLTPNRRDRHRIFPACQKL